MIRLWFRCTEEVLVRLPVTRNLEGGVAGDQLHRCMSRALKTSAVAVDAVASKTLLARRVKALP